MKFVARLLLALAVIASTAHAQVPANARTYLPVLRATQLHLWPDAPMPSFLAAQVEQESCISLSHPKCWNPHAELKTSREYGFGLGQTTIAYNADGSVRFNKWSELRQQYSSLRGWTWQDRYDAKYQLTAIVEMDHGLYARIPDAATDTDHVAFALSAYNGGASGVRQDRLLCRNRDDCDPNKWFGNVEKYSLKSKARFKGYGLSPYQINREYVRNVIYVRRPKYEPFFRN